VKVINHYGDEVLKVYTIQAEKRKLGQGFIFPLSAGRARGIISH
jgi:hypothetical protein